jgi:hypothetical protein
VLSIDDFLLHTEPGAAGMLSLGALEAGEDHCRESQAHFMCRSMGARWWLAPHKLSPSVDPWLTARGGNPVRLTAGISGANNDRKDAILLARIDI